MRPRSNRPGRLPVALATVGVALVQVLAFWFAPAPAQALTLLAVDDSAIVKHDHTLTMSAPGVMSNDVGLLGGTAILVSGPTRGSLTFRSDGSYTYVPDFRYVGVDTFSYKVRSLLLVTSNTADVTITVTNAVPVTRADAYSSAARTTLAVPAPGVLANDTDADGDSLVAELYGGGISGSLDLEPNGGFVYSPGGGFSGIATFQYRVSDGIGWSAPATVTLTITAASPSPNPTPTATPQPTPAPSSTPTPTLPLPSLPLPSQPLPTLPLPTLPELPLPTLPALTPAPTASASPTAAPPSLPGDVSPAAPVTDPGDSPSPEGAPDSSSPAAGGDGSSGGAPRPGGGGGSAPAPIPVPVGPGGLGLRTGAQTTGSLSVQIAGDFDLSSLWFVPAVAVGAPGLLAILWLALQVLAGAVWLPATRRLRGDKRSEAAAWA